MEERAGDGTWPSLRARPYRSGPAVGGVQGGDAAVPLGLADRALERAVVAAGGDAGAKSGHGFSSCCGCTFRLRRLQRASHANRCDAQDNSAASRGAETDVTWATDGRATAGPPR